MFQTYQSTFERYLASQDFIGDPLNLTQPIDYFFSMGGKRVRPTLCLLSYELFEKDFKRALPQALAVEMFHNFSLVHDDIMDEAPIRRGKVTTHQRFGLNSAILSGDAMLILTYKYLIDNLKPNQLSLALRLFTKTAIQICRGQQYDMDFEEKREVSIPAYLKMIKLKTAVLLGTSMSLGGIVARRPRSEIRALRKCGIAMGMAFQLQDDILDAFGDPIKTGKQRGGDILQNKKTFLYLKALDISGGRSKADLEALFSTHEIEPEEKIDRVLDIFHSLDVQRQADALKQKYVEKGLMALQQIPLSKRKKARLLSLFAALLNRSS